MRKRKSTRKALALMVSLVLLMTVAVGATLAYLISVPSPIKNTFTPSHVTVEVDETFENNVKSDVSIKNTGDTSAYIRAAVIVTWQNEKGEIYGEMPVEGTHYTAFTSDSGWVEHTDGFYYWTLPVEAGENTGILINEIKLIDGVTPPTDYYLCVEIIASGIQSDGTNGTESAVKNAWGIDLTDNG